MAGPRIIKPYPQLLFLVPPLAIYLFASFLFELSVDPANLVIPWLLEALQGQVTPGLSPLLTELKARFVWLASALLNIIIPLIAIIFSVATIRTYLKGNRLAWTVAVGTVLCVANVAYLAYSARAGNALYDLVFGFTYKMLVRSQMFSGVFLLHVYGIIAVINILAAVTPIILLLAVCGLLALPPAAHGQDPMELAHRMSRLKEVLNVASAFLVFGVLHMSMWLNWSASLVADAALRAKIAGTAWGIAAYWGVAFTLVLALTYVPATIYLQYRARQELIGKKALPAKEALPPRELVPAKDADQWLNEHGFSFTLSNQLYQVISILAPILAAPISGALKLL